MCAGIGICVAEEPFSLISTSTSPSLVILTNLSGGLKVELSSVVEAVTVDSS